MLAAKLYDTSSSFATPIILQYYFLGFRGFRAILSIDSNITTLNRQYLTKLHL